MLVKILDYFKTIQLWAFSFASLSLYVFLDFFYFSEIITVYFHTVYIHVCFENNSSKLKQIQWGEGWAPSF